MVKIEFKKLNPNAITPTRGSEYAAGFDLYACIDEPVIIKSHETVKIPTGLAFECPIGYMGLVFARSGMATKNGLAPANKVGVCDADYRGDYTVALHNHSDKTYILEPNERMAQLVFVPFLEANLVEAEELSDTVRGDGGFGSTGNK